MIDIPLLGKSLQVTIKSPQALVYQGKAVAVTLKNDKGDLDILPYHANFISLITEMVIIYETKDSQKRFPIEEGIVKIFEDTVEIFIGIKTLS